MIIGLDFDNTIVCYNKIFHKLAVDKRLIPQEISVHKIAIRDYLREAGKESLWTSLQGEVYGTQMEQAEAYPNVIEFISKAQSRGHTVYIVSHKTKYPIKGSKWDLHQAAREWIHAHLSLDDEQIFLEPTKDSKLNRIKHLKCDLFVDDLPEILTDPLFPSSTLRVLFDPDHNYDPSKLTEVHVYSTWGSIQKMLGYCGIHR